MKNSKKLLFIAFSLFTAIEVKAQIRFEENFNWQQLLQKAKTEGKYIFIDCYATWCAPCKWMDIHIYTQNSVGALYNRDFICLKVQMDKTPNDSQTIRSGYNLAAMLERNYHIDVYPTFIFLDPNGNPVHKAIGDMKVNDFIKLASDARNPEKQYYVLLNNFQPGKLDTAEEKALAGTFFNINKELAGRLAADYLSRISEVHWCSLANLQLLNRFQSDPMVIQLVNSFLDKNQGNPNVDLLITLRKLPKAQTIAQNYIDKLPDDSLYLSKNIRLMDVFTRSPLDRGFRVFYDHADKVDAIMKSRGYARSDAVSIIYKSAVAPLLDSAKQNSGFPNFDRLRIMLNMKFDTDLVDRVIITGKLNWYKFMVLTKKDTIYWPQLIDEQIKLIDKTHSDTIAGNKLAINNICYSWIFFHSNKSYQLVRALSWMEHILADEPDATDYIDTYACLLYKNTQKDHALQLEKKALTLVQQRKIPTNVEEFISKIEDMKNGEPIWLKKKYQPN